MGVYSMCKGIANTFNNWPWQCELTEFIIWMVGFISFYYYLLTQHAWHGRNYPIELCRSRAARVCVVSFSLLFFFFFCSFSVRSMFAVRRLLKTLTFVRRDRDSSYDPQRMILAIWIFGICASWCAATDKIARHVTLPRAFVVGLLGYLAFVVVACASTLFTLFRETEIICLFVSIWFLFVSIFVHLSLCANERDVIFVASRARAHAVIKHFVH